MGKTNRYEDRLVGVIDQRARAKERKQERRAKEFMAAVERELTPKEKLDALFDKKMAVGSFARR